MFRFVPYAASMREEWDCLALSHGTIYHTTAFRQVLLDSFGYQCVYHAVQDHTGKICALVPLVAGRNLALDKAGVSLPFVNHADICGNNPDAVQFAGACLPELRDKFGLAYIELRLKDQEIIGPGWRVNLQNYTFVLPLEDEASALALSTASNRNHIRKVYKNDWFTVSFDSRHLDGFYHVYGKRMKELGSPAPDITFFQRFFQYLPDHAFLLTVLDRQTKKVVGGMLLLTSPGDQTLYYPYGATLIEYNPKYLNNFMYWEAVRFGIRHGMKQLDLGRSPAGSGTYKYKQQWGAKPVQLKYFVADRCGGAAGPPDRNKLGIFVKMWQAIPGFITDLAGRRLIKYLMP
ncbi:MAG: GNAT family N-acetyltransferase [Negativicutes bacterium]|nr:GNAT family N-acetyltransferase [Negativicutes bacterium]